MKKADLEELPVLDTRKLTPAQHFKDLSGLFDEMAESEFERLPGMVDCPARQALDAWHFPHLGPTGSEQTP